MGCVRDRKKRLLKYNVTYSGKVRRARETRRNSRPKNDSVDGSFSRFSREHYLGTLEACLNDGSGGLSRFNPPRNKRGINIYNLYTRLHNSVSSLNRS